MTTERTATWSNIGSSSVDEKSVQATLIGANLDYNVITRPALTTYNDQLIEIPNRLVTMREDTGEVFGVVSDRYQVCQNRDALEFVQYIQDVKIKKVGETRPGSLYLITELPEMTLLGDKIKPNLIFSNSHDGGGSVMSTICMLRLVCQNQFARVFKESPATMSISHRGNMDSKLTSAKETLIRTHEYMQDYSQRVTAMASKKITPKKFNEILAQVFFMNPENTERTNLRIADQRAAFQRIYDADDNQNFKGTQWGIINALGDFITHEVPARLTENWEINRFSNTIGTSRLQDVVELVRAA